MNTEKNKRTQDGYPLFGWDKVKIEQWVDDCTTVPEKKESIIDAAMAHEDFFILDKTNPYREDYERWFPHLKPMIDQSDYEVVYKDYRNFFGTLKGDLQYFSEGLAKSNGSNPKQVTPADVDEDEVVPINCDGRNKFVWIGNQRQLVYIFVKIRNKYLSNMTDLTFLNLIADCFEGPNKKQFTYESIKTAYNELDKQKLRDKDELDKHIDGIDNIK